MSRFRRSLGYGMLDQVAARIFDFATLWVVMRTLPDADLATYGIASAMMFVFSLVLVVPEAALMRDKKVWTANNQLLDYLRGFVLFAQLRVLLVATLAVVVGLASGVHNPYFVACLLALVNQLIQFAEITRLDFRIDLQQGEVLRAELILKLALLGLASIMFFYPGLEVYLEIFLAWALTASLYWCWRLNQKHGVKPHLHWSTLRFPWAALRDFSLWQHMSGVITYVIYNIDPWVLSWFSTDISTISVYTLALKISALFFTVPMFLQSMVTIFVVNCSDAASKQRAFLKMAMVNAAVSTAQLLLFIFAGDWLGTLFRGQTLDTALFYQIGIVLCVGAFALNLARPLIADLVLHASMRRLLVVVYLPALFVALLGYPMLTLAYGAVGCAYASALAYVVFAGLLIWQSTQHGVARTALFRRQALNPSPIA